MEQDGGQCFRSWRHGALVQLLAVCFFLEQVSSTGCNLIVLKQGLIFLLQYFGEIKSVSATFRSVIIPHE